MRTGQFDVAHTLINESHLSIAPDMLEQFDLLNQILEAFKIGDLLPSIAWATSKSQELLTRDSDLEFVLHKTHFTLILKERGPRSALQYARSHISSCGARYFGDISRLMCLMLYYKKPNSPYHDLLDTPSMEVLSSTFTAEFCFSLGLSPESPIFLAVQAGFIALPVLSKLEALMKTNKAEWTTSNVMPTEITLPESLTFHPIFVCPVAKEQTTEENPPIILPCGHILAEESLKSLPRRKGSQTFKCPYCPTTTSMTKVKRVYF